MDQKEFLRQQQAAAERMRRMHERSRFNDDSQNRNFENTTACLGETESQEKPKPTHNNSGTSLVDRIREPDTALLLGLLLLLSSENADRRILFALLYILI